MTFSIQLSNPLHEESQWHIEKMPLGHHWSTEAVTQENGGRGSIEKNLNHFIFYNTQQGIFNVCYI